MRSCHGRRLCYALLDCFMEFLSLHLREMTRLAKSLKDVTVVSSLLTCNSSTHDMLLEPSNATSCDHVYTLYSSYLPLRRRWSRRMYHDSRDKTSVAQTLCIVIVNRWKLGRKDLSGFRLLVLYVRIWFNLPCEYHYKQCHNACISYRIKRPKLHTYGTINGA